MNFLDFLAEDRELIFYRKSLRPIAKTVTATILLQQVIWRARNMDWRPFYKFRAPCDHRLCKEGDTWSEELGFSPKEFDNAIKHIGRKVKKHQLADEIRVSLEDEPASRSLVLYWIDGSRQTWYYFNWRLFNLMVAQLPTRHGRGELRNLPLGNYVNDLWDISVVDQRGTTKSTNGQLPITEITTDLTETTSETDNNHNNLEPPATGQESSGRVFLAEKQLMDGQADLSKSSSETDKQPLHEGYFGTNSDSEPSAESAVVSHNDDSQSDLDRLWSFYVANIDSTAGEYEQSLLNDTIVEYGPHEVEYAMKVAVKMGKKFWGYIDGVLQKRAGTTKDEGYTIPDDLKDVIIG